MHMTWRDDEISSDSGGSDLARLAKTLSQIPQFADLPPRLLAEISKWAMPCHFDAGQIIYLEGEPADRLYILEKGWIRATRMSAEGREQAMMFLRPVEIFGDIAVFTGKPYPCTVAALEPVEAWAVDKTKIYDLITRYPEISVAVIRRLGERVRYYIELVEDLSLRSVSARLANNLLKHAEASGDQLVVMRRRWATFDEMAVRLGTVRDVLSRALRELEDEGLLRVERHRIVILDPEGLKAHGKP
jgi:CRP/FNR family transcriptional regulator